MTVAFAKLYEERFGKGCGWLKLFAGFKRFRNTTPMAYLVLRTDQTSGLEAKAVICIPAVPLIKHANRTRGFFKIRGGMTGLDLRSQITANPRS